jgi:hypothetical protein
MRRAPRTTATILTVDDRPWKALEGPGGGEEHRPHQESGRLNARAWPAGMGSSITGPRAGPAMGP